MKKRVLIIIYTTIGRQLNARSLRALKISEYLSDKYEVTLAVDSILEETYVKNVNIIKNNLRSLIKEIINVDIIMSYEYKPLIMLLMKILNKVVITDFYGVPAIELLARYKYTNEGMCKSAACKIEGIIFKQQIKYSDYYLVHEENVKMFISGALCYSGRITPGLYKKDAEMNKMIKIVQFGIDRNKCLNIRRDIEEGNKKNIVWYGAFTAWNDFELLKEFAEDYIAKRKDTKLYFVGVEPDNRIRNIYEEFIYSIKGIPNIEFIERVEHNKRVNILKKMDLGIYLHRKELETDLSLRTRLFDIIEAGIPVISSEGGGFNKIIEKYGIGIVLKKNTIKELETAIDKYFNDDKTIEMYKSNIRYFMEKEFYSWNTVLKGLEINIEKVNVNISIFNIADIMVNILGYYYYSVIKTIYEKGVIGTIKTVVKKI